MNGPQTFCSQWLILMGARWAKFPFLSSGESGRAGVRGMMTGTEACWSPSSQSSIELGVGCVQLLVSRGGGVSERSSSDFLM